MVLKGYERERQWDGMRKGRRNIMKRRKKNGTKRREKEGRRDDGKRDGTGGE